MTDILRHAPHFETVIQAGDHALLRIVDDPLVWADSKRWFEVPVGFVFDGASVPNALYPLIDATALDLIIPGACHDYLYRMDAMVIDVPTGLVREVDRHEADRVLSKVCEYVGVDWDDRKKIYYGVRVGGGGSWQKKPVL